jgi:hypothetical protein
MAQGSLVAVSSLVGPSHVLNSAVSEARMKDLYFAYGSNMNLSQISSRCSRPVAIAVACLKDHRLVFCGHSDIWDGGIETVEPAPGEEVWGVLFSLSNMNWERLDLWQDARMDGGGMYFHIPMVVADTQGHEHYVRLYKKDIQKEPTKPSREYLDFIVQGAVQNGLPRSYTDALRSRPAKPALYPVPLRGMLDLGQAAGFSCSDCAS